MGFIATPGHSTEIIQTQWESYSSGRARIVFIDSFMAYDLLELMSATTNLKRGDTLTIRTHGLGGGSFTCIGMMQHIDSLKARGVFIRTETFAVAASANFFIWLTGDERVVHADDLLMSHLSIIYDEYGNIIPVEDLEWENQMIINHINKWLRIRLSNIVKNKQYIEEMLDDPSNWYTGEELYKMGIATKII